MTAGPPPGGPAGATTPYARLDEEGQIEVLRRVALSAAPGFGLDVADLRVVLHGYNTTFRLDATDGRRVAVRVNTNSQSSPANVAAQTAWQHAIRADTEVLVPDPLPALDGGYVALVGSPEFGRDVIVTASSWLEGPDVERCTPEQARVLGAAMAALHTHAEGWRLPDGGALPVFDRPLFGDPDALTGAVAGDGELAALIAETTAASDAGFDAAYAGRTLIPVHADLHGGNLKWHEGRLGIFDFDDTGLGTPLLDLSIATFYLRDAAGVRSEAALRAGYETVRPLPDLEQLEALVVARQLLLANSLLASSTAAWRADGEAYLATTARRLRHWQETGYFRLDA